MYTMKIIQKNIANDINLNKRRSLINMAGIAAGGVMAASPLLAGATFSSANRGAFPDDTALTNSADLHVTLISIPNKQHETLKIANLSNQDIEIERFYGNKLIFDGEVVDCNDACAQNTIAILAKNDVLIQFKPESVNLFDSGAGDYLDAHSLVSRLPAGTRVIRLSAYMRGNAAVLIQPENNMIA